MKLQIWQINDDDDFATTEAEDIKERWPDVEVRHFRTVLDAWKAEPAPAVIIIDISAVGSIMGGPRHCYSPICSIADKHPGAPIIINSAVSSYFAQDVKELVMERCPDSVIRLVSWCGDPFEHLVKHLNEFLPATSAG